MDKLSLDQMIEKALKKVIDEVMEKATEETREVSKENNKEEKEKLVITIDDEGVLIDGMGDQATLLNGVNAKFETFKSKLGQ